MSAPPTHKLAMESDEGGSAVERQTPRSSGGRRSRLSCARYASNGTASAAYRHQGGLQTGPARARSRQTRLRRLASQLEEVGYVHGAARRLHERVGGGVEGGVGGGGHRLEGS